MADFTNKPVDVFRQFEQVPKDHVNALLNEIHDRILDDAVVAQLTILDRDLATPPASPNTDDMYLVATSGIGAWFGQDGKLAVWNGTEWLFYVPKIGWKGWIADEQKFLVYDGTGWVVVGNTTLLNRLENTTNISVLDRDLATPPPSTNTDDMYLVATSGTGAWFGQDGNLAVWNGTEWLFYVPKIGWKGWIADEQKFLVYDGASWQELGATGPTGADGLQGPAGTDGVGVPVGGTTGQVLTKNSSADHDTGWVDAGSGGGGSTTLDGLADTDVTGVAGGDTLTYNSASAKWVPGNGAFPVPIGCVLPWHKTMTGVPVLPDGWLECNGQVINDTASPMNGQSMPDLNSQVYAGGRGRYLRGGNTSGVTNESTKFLSHASMFRWSSTGTPTYFGIPYGQLLDGEKGNTLLYNTSDNTLGNNQFQVAAMTMVYIMRIK